LSTGVSTTGFTFLELTAIVAACGLLMLVALPALGNARIHSRQLACLNNLRQLAVATRLYVVDYQEYSGSLSTVPTYTYVWPKKLLPYTEG
jgi:Tfp pilus assembly protein PilE